MVRGAKGFFRPSRRAVLKAAGAAAAGAAVTRAAAGQEPASPSPERVFWYVDGYHGGVDGHMPPASLRNVLDGLDRFPRWKVSFEIEPYSWAAFAKTDPQSIGRLKQLLADATPAARVEIVSGAYGQPYAWNASGESNIRHLAYGLAELRAVFPDVVVDTYAVQEPCWTSCLPQLLKSFGYRRAVLKNSTCWGGYHATMVDADLVHWVGPDGTRITAVPRYTVEDLVPPATTLGSQPTVAFIDRCVELGIKHPAGTTLQDMGWPGRPWRFGMEPDAARALRHVTWREYVDTVASPPALEWKASQEDLRVGLPWGASVLQRIAQVVRSSENLLVQTEKLATMAFARRGSAFPGAALKQAWQDLLWSQHHDVWIVSYNRHKDGTWASAADAKAEKIDAACKQATAEAIASIAPPPDDSKPGRFVRVFNTTGSRRRDLASVELRPGELPGARPRVLDPRGAEVPCQLVPPAGDSSRGTTLLFPAEVPALGHATYQLAAAETDSLAADRGPASAATRSDGTVTLTTDLFAIIIDPARGGRVSSLLVKDLGKEFVDATGPRSFNEFRGYFPSEGKWLSSTDTPADVSVVEEGPLRVVASVRGRIGRWPFVTRVSAATGRRRIDFRTTFEFPVDSPPYRAAPRRRQESASQDGTERVRIGQTWEPGRDATRSSRRPFYDASFKLQALFPVKLRRPTLDNNAPFDVCRSGISDTRFDAWDGIKHNLIFNWVDLLDEDGSAGLAVMSDHATSYNLSRGEPLGLVMGYAGAGIWHEYGIGRVPQVSYSVVPHAGDWAAARLWRELGRWGEPLLTSLTGEDAGADSEWSLLDVSDSGLDVTTALVEDRHALVRLFNAEGSSGPQRITLDGRVTRVQLVELDGRVMEDLPVERGPGGTVAVTVNMDRFSVRTLRCVLT